MENHHQKLKRKFNSLLDSPFLNFTEVASKKNLMGVYIVFSSVGKIIYIGSTNKFNVRFGTDLKHPSTHTLMRKFLKTELFEERLIAVDYLINKCIFKIELCESKREAEALEHFAIWILNPEYNR